MWSLALQARITQPHVDGPQRVYADVRDSVHSSWAAAETTSTDCCSQQMIGAGRPRSSSCVPTAVIKSALLMSLFHSNWFSCKPIDRPVGLRYFVVCRAGHGRYVLGTVETDGDVAAVGLSSARWHRPGYAALRWARTYIPPVRQLLDQLQW